MLLYVFVLSVAMTVFQSAASHWSDQIKKEVADFLFKKSFLVCNLWWIAIIFAVIPFVILSVLFWKAEKIQSKTNKL